MTVPICPSCGAPMVLHESTVYTYPDGRPRLFWGCSNFPVCRIAHGAHPDGSPLGVPADQETRRARIAAHDAFDRLWQEGDSPAYTRQGAYGWLQRKLGMTPDQAHIANFNKEQCQKVIDLVNDKLGPPRPLGGQMRKEAVHA